MRKPLIHLFIFALFVLFMPGLTTLLRAQVRQGNPPSKQQTAFQFYQQRDFKSALPLFQELYESAQGSSMYPYYLQCLIETKNFNQAEEVVKKELKKTPSQQRLEVDLGYVYLMSGKNEKAQRTFENAIRSVDKNPQAASPLGMAFRAYSLNEYALRVYMKAREVMKDPNAFALEIAGIYEATGDFRKMTDAFMDILTTTPGQMANLQARLQFYLSQLPEPENQEYLWNTLRDRAKKNPSAIVFQEMLYWYATQQRKYDEAIEVALKLIKQNNEDGSRLLSLARNCIIDGLYDLALKALTPLYAQGRNHPFWTEIAKSYFTARYEQITHTNPTPQKEIKELAEELDRFLTREGNNTRTVEIVRLKALIEGRLKQQPLEAIEILKNCLNLSGLTPQGIYQLKNDLAEMYVLAHEPWEAALIYAQLERDLSNSPEGDAAKLAYARLMYELGEYRWALMHLNLLRGATDKLTANDAQELWFFINTGLDYDSSGLLLDYFGSAALLKKQRNYQAALQTLDSVIMASPLGWGADYALLEKARIYKELKQTKEADSLYSRVARVYPSGLAADDALIELGEMRESENNQSGALEAYEKLVIEQPGSFWVEKARQRISTLRYGKK
ncbi:MAG: tetratricopeptide repeat protein [Bacteroidales bacterium]